MPVDLHPPPRKPDRETPSVATGIVLTLWALAMIAITLLTGATPPSG
jgi:hypothetical protein